MFIMGVLVNYNLQGQQQESIEGRKKRLNNVIKILGGKIIAYSKHAKNIPMVTKTQHLENSLISFNLTRNIKFRLFAVSSLASKLIYFQFMCTRKEHLFSLSGFYVVRFSLTQFCETQCGVIFNLYIRSKFTSLLLQEQFFGHNTLHTVRL